MFLTLTLLIKSCKFQSNCETGCDRWRDCPHYAGCIESIQIIRAEEAASIDRAAIAEQDRVNNERQDPKTKGGRGGYSK